MAEPQPFPLSPIDNAMGRHYPSKILFFPQSPGTDPSIAVKALRDGLAKTLEVVTVLAGTVQVIGHGGELGVIGPWHTVEDMFRVKDLTHDGLPDYQRLKDGHFSLPMEALDWNVLLPVAEIMKDVKPVMIVLLNIIRGGMIMTLCLHHSFADGIGCIGVARIWAEYCRGQDGSRLFRREMLDRERLMRGEGSATLAEMADYVIRPSEQDVSSSDKKEEGNPLARNQSAIFFFPKKKLAELKTMAMITEHKDGDSWVSTNDALCALLGCCVHSAIDENIRAMEDRTFTVGMTVNGRHMLDPPLPADYIGNVITYIWINVSSQSINSTPAKVADLAYRFRALIKQRDERYIRKVIGALSSVEDITRIVPRSLAPPSPLEDRLTISSSPSHRFYDLDWGDAVGARVERLRIPLVIPNYCILLPETGTSGTTREDGGLEVLINLEKEQMQRLKQIELFTKFAQWRCD